VPRGSTPARQTTVTFTGGTQLVNVAAESNYVQLAAKPIRQNGFEVAYEVTATLRGDTPVGKWYTDVWLNTNNPSSPRIRVPLTVDVEPALNLSPAAAAFGTLKPGATAERRVIVRGGQPFRIKEIDGTDETVTAAAADQEAKPAHVVTIRVKTTNAGDLSRTLKIVTDMPGESAVELPVRATVIMPKSED
jgi:hypothetical protein